jgi:CRISPR-associated protein Csd2
VKGEESPDQQARRWMCQNFFDVRMFGAVMSTQVNAGQVRGPVQIAFSQSVEPITLLEQSTTRVAVTTLEDSLRQKGGNRTMGRKEIIPYALYRCHGFVNPFFAAQTGFSEEDLKVLWLALQNMFELDRAAARGEMATQKLFVFEHRSALGNAAAHNLFQRISITRKDRSHPARKFSDYDLTVDRENLADVALHELG